MQLAARGRFQILKPQRWIGQNFGNPLGFTVTNYRVDAETLRAREN